MYAPSATPPPRPPGGYTVADLRDGDRFELSKGTLIECHPAGNRHTRSVRDAAVAITTDPAVHSSGVDAGHQLAPDVLRAPDVSIGIGDSDAPGWLQGPPLLAIEQASVGQKEEELKTKIAELLQAGTRYVWVVRLTGPQHVEVHERGRAMRRFLIDDTLTAPGILKNPVPVRVFFDGELAGRAALKNLLDRYGYGDAAPVALHAKATALVAVLDARKIVLTPAQRARLTLCEDSAQIDRWLIAAATANTAADLGL
jgi:Uma2 family endonuclease